MGLVFEVWRAIFPRIGDEFEPPEDINNGPY
jgi:hypothetical protein